MTNHTITTFAGLTNAINELKKEQAAVKVDAAIREGLLDPAQRSWGIAHCIAYPPSFEAFLGVARQHQREQQDKHQSTIFHKMGLTEQQVAAVKEKLAVKR
jgi:hypothetical protein